MASNDLKRNKDIYDITIPKNMEKEDEYHTTTVVQFMLLDLGITSNKRNVTFNFIVRIIIDRIYQNTKSVSESCRKIASEIFSYDATYIYNGIKNSIKKCREIKTHLWEDIFGNLEECPTVIVFITGVTRYYSKYEAMTAYDRMKYFNRKAYLRSMRHLFKLIEEYENPEMAQYIFLIIRDVYYDLYYKYLPKNT